MFMHAYLSTISKIKAVLAEKNKTKTLCISGEFSY